MRVAGRSRFWVAGRWLLAACYSLSLAWRRLWLSPTAHWESVRGPQSASHPPPPRPQCAWPQVCQEGAAPEVLGLLIGKFLGENTFCALLF